MKRYSVHVLALQRPSRLLMTASVVMLTMLLAAYGPMTSISSAQAAVDASKLQDLKQKAMGELDRRIINFQKTLNGMKVDATVSASKDGVSSSASSGNGSAASFSIGKDGIDAVVTFPGSIKDKAKQFLQKIIDELKQLREKVKNADSLEKMKSYAQNVDAQYGLNQLGQVQSAVTQAAHSLTGVFDKLKTTAKSLQGQVTKIKDCLKNGGATVNANGSSKGCERLNVSSDEVAEQAQSQLDNISTIMSTIASLLTSTVALLTTLLAQFGSIANSLGSLGSVGNIGNLSNLSNSTDLSGLAGSAGSISGLLTSFSGLASQLDVANGMSGNVQSALGPLSNFVNL